MDDAALVGVHGLHGKAATGLAYLGADALCQCGQIALTLVAVTGNVQTQLDVIALQTVCHKACQIGQALHGLATAADEGAQLFTVQTDDGGFALLHGAEGHVLHAHQGDDFPQIVHSGLHLGVLLDDDGHFHLFCLLGSFGGLLGSGGLLCGGSGGLLHSSGRFLCHRSSLLHGGSSLNRLLCHRLHRLCGCSGGGIRQFHAHAHLGGGGL